MRLLGGKKNVKIRLDQIKKAKYSPNGLIVIKRLVKEDRSYEDVVACILLPKSSKQISTISKLISKCQLGDKFFNEQSTR